MVYTRTSTVPAKYRDRIKAAFAKANVDYGKFKEVDNSCKYVIYTDGRTDFLGVCIACSFLYGCARMPIRR